MVFLHACEHLFSLCECNLAFSDSLVDLRLVQDALHGDLALVVEPDGRLAGVVPPPLTENQSEQRELRDVEREVLREPLGELDEVAPLVHDAQVRALQVRLHHPAPVQPAQLLPILLHGNRVHAGGWPVPELLGGRVHLVLLPLKEELKLLRQRVAHERIEGVLLVLNCF